MIELLKSEIWEQFKKFDETKELFHLDKAAKLITLLRYYQNKENV